MTEQPRLGRQRQPPLTLVQMRQQYREPRRDLIADLSRDGHTGPSNRKPRTIVLFPYNYT